jgi:aminomethyltransferase
VSHLGKGVVRGPGAVDFVNDRLTNDLRRVGVGQAQYTLCCDEETGGVVDDLIAYVRSEDEVFLIPNAANSSSGRRAAGGRRAARASRSRTLHRTLGRCSRCRVRAAGELVEAMGLPTDHDYMSFAGADWQGKPVVVCRTGYTGELGLRAAAALGRRRCCLGRRCWRPARTSACGRAASAPRDTLRTEMGYPLHGQDLSLEITPVQARSGWAVGWDKPRFWGRDVLVAEKAHGPRRVLRGLESLDRGIPRAHMVVSRDGAPVGEVTSGTFSPTRPGRHRLALLAAVVAVDGRGQRRVRGAPRRCAWWTPPFVPVAGALSPVRVSGS